MKSLSSNRLLQSPARKALGVAIALALALPMPAMAQDAPQAPETTAAAPETVVIHPADENTKLFSLDDSDDPETLKALTKISNSVEIGATYVSDDSFRFGRYTGLNEQGTTAVLNVDLLKRGDWDSDSAKFWSLHARDLGLDSREAALEFGVQGSYKFHFDYDQIPIFRSETARTIFDGVGSTNLTLPANWVGSGTTAGMTTLLPDLKPFNLKTERRRTGLGVSGVLSPRWSYTLNYKHEDKDGIKSIGGVFGNSGGNPRSVILPEPVDYTTQQIDASLNYANSNFQLEAAYYLSLFSDQNTSLSWSNPYTTISGWTAATGFPNGRGQLSLPPDNQFHQISLNAGYNISDRTRASASIARGRMTQNDAFLPYTDIPALAASITQPLPRTSLDGRIDTTVVNLRIASRPWTDFSWNASYRYDNRDNKTPRDEYVYIGGDSQTQDTSLTSSHRRFNEPYSYKEEQLKAEASYRMFGSTNLSAGVQRSKIDRTFSERERADEDTFNVALNSEVGERFNTHIRYTHAKRDGSTYFGSEPLHTGFSEEYVATVPGGFENYPGLRKYFEADRKRDMFTLMAEFMPTESWTLGAAIDDARDKYDKSEVGLIEAKTRSYSLDAAYSPSPLWSVYANGTWEKLTSDQNGHSFSGGASQVAQAADPNRDWFVGHDDRIDSYAAGYQRSLPNKHLDFGFEYLYSKSRSDLTFAVGSALTTKPLPRDVTKLNSLNVHGTYRFRENMSLRLNVWYENYHSNDWALDGIAPNTLANVILLGEDSPDYNVFATSISLIYRF